MAAAGESGEELIDRVDEHDQVIGSVNRPHADADPTLIHREIAVLIHRSELLLWQQRSATKEVMPGVWDISCAGHVRAGESPIVAAHRELLEELGFDTRLAFAGRRLVRQPWETYVLHVFAGQPPAGAGPMLDPQEVATIQWGGEQDLPGWQAAGRTVSPVALALARAFWRRGDESLWAQAPADGD